MGALHLVYSRRIQDRVSLQREAEPSFALRDAEFTQLSLRPEGDRNLPQSTKQTSRKRPLRFGYHSSLSQNGNHDCMSRSVDFSLFPLLERLRAEFVLPCAEKGLHFAVVAQDVRVYTDPFQLETILRYLIKNAIRFTPEGCIRVGLRRENQYWRIEVWDTGVGISKQQQQSIFDESLVSSDSGSAVSGMNLPMLARLCAQLDLPLHLRSKPGLGTLFSVDVPIVAGRTPTFFPDDSGPLSAAFADSLVLLVEAEDSDSYSLAAWLRTWGCSVVVARSGDTALKALGGLDKAPDLIMSDYRLAAEETGVAVIQRLHQYFNAPIPSLLLAGAAANDEGKVARSGAFPVLQRPLQPQRVYMVIARLLGVALLYRE